MTTATATQFDFSDVNKATANLSPGMKLAIAQGLLTQAANGYTTMKRDEAKVVLAIGADLKALRDQMKAAFEAKSTN